MEFSSFKKAVEGYTFDLLKPPKNDDAYQQVRGQQATAGMRGIALLRRQCASAAAVPICPAQGGLFIFDGEEIVYAHKDQGTADHAPMEEVLEACCGVAA